MRTVPSGFTSAESHVVTPRGERIVGSELAEEVSPACGIGNSTWKQTDDEQRRIDVRNPGARVHQEQLQALYGRRSFVNHNGWDRWPWILSGLSDERG
jgi:hypothetical protein